MWCILMQPNHKAAKLVEKKSKKEVEVLVSIYSNGAFVVVVVGVVLFGYWCRVCVDFLFCSISCRFSCLPLFLFLSAFLEVLSSSPELWSEDYNMDRASVYLLVFIFLFCDCRGERKRNLGKSSGLEHTSSGTYLVIAIIFHHLSCYQRQIWYCCCCCCCFHRFCCGCCYCWYLSWYTCLCCSFFLINIPTTSVAIHSHYSHNPGVASSHSSSGASPFYFSVLVE